ncbi:MAG: nuclear transport factor 2 family protein [Chitinophagales bacterium]
MTISETIQSYLHALERGDEYGVLQLFADNAIVISPLYGRMKANDFYEQLFEDTAQSLITLLQIFKGAQPGSASAHFRYRWTLEDEQPVTFEAVDIFEFDNQKKISKLTIIYDTVYVREAFERLRG